MRRVIRSLVCSLLGAAALGASAQGPEVLPAEEIAQRNAAAAFVIQRSMTLAVLRAECRTLMSPGPLRVDEIAQNWWSRQRDALDAANSWLRTWLDRLQASDPAAHRQASVELVAASAQGTLESLRLEFRRRLPDDRSCQQALQPFDEQVTDIERLGGQPGGQRYADIAAALQRIRAEAGWQVLPQEQRTFEAQISTGPLPALMASLDAARRAREDNDMGQMVRAYASMVQRGDGAAAVTLGHVYQLGDLLPRDLALAYGWFHRAYVLGNGTGLVAMAQAWQSGQGVPAADPRTALGALALAGAISRDPAERQRAQAQAEALASRLGEADRAAVACMRVSQLDDAVAAPIGPQALRPQLPQPQRRLGELLPSLQELATRCG